MGRKVKEHLLVVVELVVPIVHVFTQVHLLSSPETSLSFLVHLPDLIMRKQTRKESYKVSHVFFRLTEGGSFFEKQKKATSRVDRV